MQRGYKSRGINSLDFVSYDDLAELQYAYRNKEEALVINRVDGFEYSFATNIVANRTVLANLLNTEVDDIHPKMLSYMQNLISPKLVASGPCQEMRLIGHDVDLANLPAIQFNEEDAGRYLTAGIVFAKDRRNPSFQNASVHRVQLQGKNQLGIRLEKGHLLALQQEAEKAGQDLEVAIAIGTHPAEMVASVSGLDYGVSEMALAGAIRGEALEMVHALTVDVDVPTTADIIIEGVIPAYKRELEGPFGDFQGYYVNPAQNHIVIVNAVTHTKDKPIFTSIRAGSHEDSLLLGLKNEVKIYEALMGKHKVTGVNLSPMVFNCIISIEKQNDAEPHEIIENAFSQYPWLKYCVVVDEDVDCYNMEDVWWAIGTRSNPSTGSSFIKSDASYNKDPYHIHSGKLGIDATVPCQYKHFFRRAKPKKSVY